MGPKKKGKGKKGKGKKKKPDPGWAKVTTMVEFLFTSNHLISIPSCQGLFIFISEDLFFWSLIEARTICGVVSS